MPKIELAATYPFSLEEAKRRLATLFTKFSSVADVNVHWFSENTAAITGKRVEGTLTLKDAAMEMTLALSFVLLPMKSQIKDRVTTELTNAGFVVAV
jgi:Putative polyhydroxyalkanoic acid system protein (PHA_gran_rgn)